MKYIEVQEGISVNVNNIESIEKLDENSCKIFTHHHTYLATFPYTALLEMLKQDDIIDKKHSSDDIMKSTMKKVDKILNNSQYFAG